MLRWPEADPVGEKEPERSDEGESEEPQPELPGCGVGRMRAKVAI